MYIVVHSTSIDASAKCSTGLVRSMYFADMLKFSQLGDVLDF